MLTYIRAPCKKKVPHVMLHFEQVDDETSNWDPSRSIQHVSKWYIHAPQILWAQLYTKS